jgi:hypothetical protein
VSYSVEQNKLHEAESFLRSQQYAQVVSKLPVFYGTRWFITVFIRSRHQSLSWPRWIQSIAPKPYFPKIYFNIILPSTPRSSEWSLPFRLSKENALRLSYLTRPVELNSFIRVVWSEHAHGAVQCTEAIVLRLHSGRGLEALGDWRPLIPEIVTGHDPEPLPSASAPHNLYLTIRFNIIHPFDSYKLSLSIRPSSSSFDLQSQDSRLFCLQSNVYKFCLGSCILWTVIYEYLFCLDVLSTFLSAYLLPSLTNVCVIIHATQTVISF